MSETRTNPDAARRRLLLIVGKGRSGTSLAAGIFGRLGFHVPQPEVKADESNPRGFGEPRWAVRFHQSLMRPRRVTVSDARPAAWATLAEVADDEAVIEELRSWLAVQFVGTENVVVKDPRAVWFLPLWRRGAEAVDAETSFLTMLRHPAEVVASARKWYGDWQVPASRAAAWLNVTLHTEVATRGSLRAFVRYADLLEDWPRQVSRCAEVLEFPWLADLKREDHPEADSFVDPTLRRSGVDWEGLEIPSSVRELCEEVWTLVSRLADEGGDTPEAQAALDESRAAYVRLYSEAEAISQSSVNAVKPRRMLAYDPPLAAAEKRARSPLRKAARRVPRGVRRRLPLERARTAFDETRGLPLPLRAMLLVPHRYRERMPLPVVHAARRVARSMRR